MVIVWILDFRSAEIGDCGGLCLDRRAMWVVGQVVGLDRWINVLWVMWWRGFGSVEIGGFLDGDWGFLGGMGSSGLELIV